ncbi:MAG: hypothetical protein CVV03_00620 [Firmicutes bacterium HGW-Firmicutes-8]|nr:MAG: hypothetical protein CVV03_00620 [Firmicutes bacterium HGW-Firmicutes-8]
MKKLTNSFKLSKVIEPISKQVQFVTENYIVDRDYEGIYADVSNDEELHLLHEIRQGSWQDVVAKEFASSSPWLYQVIVDGGRAIFLDLLEIPQGGTFLDVGSGWGQVSLPLARYGEVIALDLTANRINILQAIAQQEQIDLYYAQGNFITFPFKQNSFELIIFNGSLEWIGLGRTGEQSILDVQCEALRKASKLLKKGGHIYIGIENSLGLKYLLGAYDDHTGLSFISFLPERVAEQKYNTIKQSERLPAKTWSLEEYRQMIRKAGLKLERVYCCFPDYKIIRQMVDIRTINKFVSDYGLIVSEHNGTDGSLLGFEKELDAIYRLLGKNGIAQYFCPSYGIIACK